MTRNDKQSTTSFGVKICIWTIRNQSWLAGHVRIYIYAGTALIAFLALAGVISIETAMFSAFCGGTIAMGLIWTFVQQRKAVLLNIREPELRDLAHKAMLAYLHEVDPNSFAPAGVKHTAGKHREECPECSLP